MRPLDRACAGALFLLAVVECWLVPRNYTGRLWIFGTGLALLFTAMLTCCASATARACAASGSSVSAPT
jgi:hypothetical protein